MNPTTERDRKGRGRTWKTGAILIPLVVLIPLLILPGYALSKISPRVDWRVLLGAAIGLSGITFLIYRTDKRRAEAGAWRIPESTLHFASLIGGWPGAFLAQRTYRHKTSKTSFQLMFWFIVFLHYFVAVDSLLGWRFTMGAMRAIQSRLAQGDPSPGPWILARSPDVALDYLQDVQSRAGAHSTLQRVKW